MICKWCNKEFSITYSRSGIPVFCSKSCAGHNGNGNRKNWTKLELIHAVGKMISENATANKSILSRAEILRELHVSSKTWSKFSLNLYNICSDLGINNSGGVSKFQTKVINVIRKVFKDCDIYTEYNFEGKLRNPNTNRCLRVDIFVPKFGLVIECDGRHHIEPGHYYNTITKAHGYIPVICTDPIKETWLIKNGFEIVRIPYANNLKLSDLKILFESWLSQHIVINDPSN